MTHRLLIQSVGRLEADPALSTCTSSISDFALEYWIVGELHRTVITIVVVMWINQLKKMRLLTYVSLRKHITNSDGIFVVNEFLYKLMKDSCIFLFDKLMALFEASWQEANVFETFSIKHFYDEFEDFVVEVSDVQIVICLTHLFVGKRTLAKVGLPDEVISLFVVSGNFLRVQTKQTNVDLIFAIVEPLSDLIQEVSFVATICYFELRASRKHGFLLKHQCSTVYYDQSQTLAVLLGIHGHSICLAFVA